MSIRFGQGVAEYDRLMYRTRWLSLSGMLLITVMVAVGLVEGLRYFYLASPLPSDAQYLWIKVVLLRLLMVIGTGVRVFCIFGRRASRSWLVYLSWLGVFVPMFLYFADSQDYWRPQPFTIYTFYSDPLESVWSVFLFLSGLRFIGTVLEAIRRSRVSVVGIAV